ncbi:MAG: hypothetical protein WC379_05515 [Methanoregula sp.]|jgi:hypothetical protein
MTITGGRNKVLAGTLFGAVAGIIDVIPMVIQSLSWDANISAFALWVVSGFLISTSDLQITGWLKGLLISALVLTPSAILIMAKEPASIVPIGIMTLLLGGCLGHCIERFTW